MKDTVLSIVFCATLFVGAPLLILVLRDRSSAIIWRFRNPPEKLTADRRAYEARILHPDWTFYERHLQRSAPAALRELYADHVLITTQGVDYFEHASIGTFAPLDEQGLIDSCLWLGFDIVSIAISNAGDPIYLRPGPTESDVVYMTAHDGGETGELAPDIATFLRRLRPMNRDA